MYHDMSSPKRTKSNTCPRKRLCVVILIFLLNAWAQTGEHESPGRRLVFVNDTLSQKGHSVSPDPTSGLVWFCVV